MALSARKYFSLDEVWLIPAGHSPNKNEADMTAAEHRFRMCELTARANEGFTVSRYELDSPERSYTYRTLEHFRTLYPNDNFFFIMGGDSLDYLERWMKPEVICSCATILVVPRDQFHTNAMLDKIKQLEVLFPCDIRIVPCSMYPLSSTQIREKLKNGSEAEHDFPPGVLEYIRENGLYQ